MANTELIAQLESLDATELAKWMHEHYELLAQELGWETQKLTRVDYDRLPPENKAVMFRMACSILEKFNLPQILQALRVQEAADEHLEYLQVAAYDAGEKAGEAFSKSKYSTADYWLCVEFKLQRIHDDFAKSIGDKRKCGWSKYREFISEKRHDWRALQQSNQEGELKK